MVKLLAEILFSSLEAQKQQVCLIENGIGSIVKKCQQVNRNAAILESELLSDLHLIDKLGTKKQSMDKITFNTGIASWNEDPEYASKKLSEYDVNFGIIVNEAPPLSQEFKINLSSKILYLLRTADYSQKKINTVKRELSISEKNSLDLDATYELIQNKQIGNVSLHQNSIAGKVAEAYMQYVIADAVYQQGRSIRLHHGFETKGRDIQINGNNMTYNTPTEMDFILTYKKKDRLTMLKNKLQEEQKIKLIDNQESKTSFISYKNNK